MSLAVLRERACRIERLDELRDPSAWASPYLVGEGVVFSYADAPQNTMTLGASGYSFSLSVSECDVNSIYVYSEYVGAVGLVVDAVPYESLDAGAACGYLVPGGTIVLKTGQVAVLRNDGACLCAVRLMGAKRERSDGVYQKSEIVFDYRILIES